MTLRKIARLGHPVLLARAEPVADPTAPATRALIADMLETVRDAGGIGLAAPQVYAGVRVIVAYDMRDRVELDTAPLRVLINPELEPLGSEQTTEIEGCLSIPELRGAVTRWRSVGWRALDQDGHAIEGEAEALFARVLQHEVDHLDGILYPMRLSDPSLLAVASEVGHLQERLKAGDQDR